MTLRTRLKLRSPRGALRCRDAQDAVAMDVLDERVEARLALRAPNREDRQLALERNERLEHERCRTERLPCARDVGLGAQDPLTLAVVAESPRLQDGRQTKCGDRSIELL